MGSRPNASCLELDKTYSLTGIITMHKAEVVGHPSDGRRYAVLNLINPICVSGDDENYPEDNVTVISLGGGNRTWPYKRQVIVTGKISHGQTLWHRYRILMDVEQIKREVVPASAKADKFHPDMLGKWCNSGRKFRGGTAFIRGSCDETEQIILSQTKMLEWESGCKIKKIKLRPPSSPPEQYVDGVEYNVEELCYLEGIVWDQKSWYWFRDEGAELIIRVDWNGPDRIGKCPGVGC